MYLLKYIKHCGRYSKKSQEYSYQRYRNTHQINPSTKITISNVYPITPNKSITKALLENAIRISSSIFSLKSTHSSDLFAHVTSFRRQVYVDPEDVHKLPGSLITNQEGTNFRIYLTEDSVSCYVCKQSGHIASSCKYNTDNSTFNPLPADPTPFVHPVSSSQLTETPSVQYHPSHSNTKPLESLILETPSTKNPNLQLESKKRAVSISSCPSTPPSPAIKTTSTSISIRITTDSSSQFITSVASKSKKEIKKLKPGARSHSSYRKS